MNAREKTIAKIRALLNMNTKNGCTEAEAMVAAERASKLMAEYDIQLLDVAGEEQAERYGKRGRKFAQGNVRRKFPESSNCINSVAGFTNCKAWIADDTLVFLGTAHDTEFAWFLMDMITKVMEKEWRMHKRTLKRKTNEHGRKLRKSFMLGMSNRISDRLDELKAARNTQVAAAGGRALMINQNAKLEATMKALGLNLKTRRPKSTRVNRSAYNQGTESANNVNFGRPVESSTTDGTRQIAARR